MKNQHSAVSVHSPLITLTEVFAESATFGGTPIYSGTRGVDVDAASIESVEEKKRTTDQDKRSSLVYLKSGRYYYLAETRDEVRDIRNKALGF